MSTLFNDLRYTVRQLAKSPGFAIIAILTLTLGIGANTAIFSVVNAVLLNPLPYPQPDRIMVLFHDKPNFPPAPFHISTSKTGGVRARVFPPWRPTGRVGGVTLSGNGEPEVVDGQMISAGLFEILGIKPRRRTFATDEDRLGANPAALISEGLWKRKFGSDPNILGKTIILDGQGGQSSASFQQAFA